jgi:hypothetical protein
VWREEKATNPLSWWYLSFAIAGPDGFQGGVIVEAHGSIDCRMRCDELGINPHGQMLAMPIPASHLPLSEFRNRLLKRQDVDEAFSGIAICGTTETN